MYLCSFHFCYRFSVTKVLYVRLIRTCYSRINEITLFTLTEARKCNFVDQLIENGSYAVLVGLIVSSANLLY